MTDTTEKNDEEFFDEEDNQEDDGAEQEDATVDEGEDEAEETLTLTQAELDERIKAARKEQDKRWRERIKKDDKPKEAKPKNSEDDRFDRLELKTEGIKDKAQQDLVLDYAKLKGVSISEALSSSVIKAELKAMSEEVAYKQAIPQSSTRTAQPKKDDIDYLVRQYEQGKLPSTPEGRKKLLDYLKRN